ncbi:MAG TPA: hypothetical protein VFR41_06640 [Acidimicrobiia bacterium]|nr:hypothetical protein [Acidimicrobiia bacterium]
MNSGPPLEPGEQLLASARASFRGATAATLRSTAAFGSARVRNRAYEAWRGPVDAAGFPTVAADMLLDVTDRRIITYAPTFFGRRNSSSARSLPLERIGEVACVRHGLILGMAFALTDGPIIELEAMHMRRLRRFAGAVAQQIAKRR